MQLLGYWFPFEAARAMAAKFCYKIRYALTIVFGEDFPSICLPETHEDFGKYYIDRAIIARCQQRANDQKRLEAERRRQGEATLTPATPRYATPAESTPGRSNLYNTSPEMGSTPREQSRFFDPVRDNFTGGNSQRPDILSPNNPWNPGPNISTPPSHERQLMPSPNYYQYSPYESSAQSSHAVRPTTENNRYHPYSYPYSSYAAGRSTPTPMGSPSGIGGSPPQMLGSPAESLISNDASRIPKLPPYHHGYFQTQPPMSPEFSPSLYSPLVRIVPESGIGQTYYPQFPPIIPQRRQSPIPQHESDIAHDSKRRCVSGQPSPPPEYCGRLEESTDLCFVQIHGDSMVPAPVNSYTRSPMPSMILPPMSSVDSDSERDVAEAAAGLMDLRRKDTELESSNYRRKSA